MTAFGLLYTALSDGFRERAGVTCTVPHAGTKVQDSAGQGGGGSKAVVECWMRGSGSRKDGDLRGR